MRTFCPPSSSLCSEVTVLTGLHEPVISPEPDHSVIIIIVTIVIITFSRLLSLFRVLTTRVVSVITDIVTIIADNQPCMVLLVRRALLVLIFPYYVSFIVHIGMRGALC